MKGRGRGFSRRTRKQSREDDVRRHRPSPSKQGLRNWLAAFAALPLAMQLGSAPARAADPIKIGMSMALTGGLASGGKVMLITLKMWEDDVNARGGLLGRPVQLVYYDDQSNGSLVPGIYTKLLDVDKVDRGVELRHQCGRAGDADRHAAQQ